MVVLAHGSVHARPYAQPFINVSGIFLVHMSAELPKIISPNPYNVICKVSEPLKIFDPLFAQICSI